MKVMCERVVKLIWNKYSCTIVVFCDSSPWESLEAWSNTKESLSVTLSGIDYTKWKLLLLTKCEGIIKQCQVSSPLHLDRMMVIITVLENKLVLVVNFIVNIIIIITASQSQICQLVLPKYSFLARDVYKRQANNYLLKKNRLNSFGKEML